MQNELQEEGGSFRGAGLNYWNFGGRARKTYRFARRLGGLFADFPHDAVEDRFCHVCRQLE